MAKKLNLKKFLLSGMSYALVAALAIGGTIAYLTSEDSDVNVMTMGNVEIVQNEHQRVEENGVFTSELEEFEQGKPLMPYTDRVGGTDTVTVGDKTFRLGDTYHNFIDKVVTVTNNGKSDAFVRTLIAIPTGGADWETTPVAAADVWLHWNPCADGDDNGLYVRQEWDSCFNNDGKAGDYAGVFTEINGQGYYVWEFTGKEALKPGETTYPSLVGTFMDKRVDADETGYYMDLNSNHKWDEGERRIEDLEVGGTTEILVVSQAVQTAGFADAQTALDTAFGEVSDANAIAWFGGLEIPVVVDNAEDFVNAIAEGKDVILNDDIELNANNVINVAANNDITVNLNGNKISATADKTGNQELFLVKGTLSVENGEMALTSANNQGWNSMATIFDVTAGGVLNLDGVTADVSGTDMNFIIHLNNWGEVTLNINDCDFTSTYTAVRVFNAGPDMNNVTIKNTDFHGGRAFWVHNYGSSDFSGKLWSSSSQLYDVEKVNARLNFDIYNNNTSDNSKPVRYGFNDDIYYDMSGNKI